MAKRKFNIMDLISLFAIAAIIAALFFPWINYFKDSISGWQIWPGVITFILSASTVLLILSRIRLVIIPVIAAFVAILYPFLLSLSGKKLFMAFQPAIRSVFDRKMGEDAAAMAEMFPSTAEQVELGVGVYIAIASCILLLISRILHRHK